MSSLNDLKCKINEIEKKEITPPCENFFDKIPDEIVSLIFEMLEIKEQQCLTKVCRRFKTLTPKSFNRTLKLEITNKTRLQDIYDFPYNDINAKDANLHSIRKKLFKIVKTHKKSIQKIKISNGSEMFVTKILSLVKDNLTVLDLSSIERRSIDPYDKIKIDFPKLKKLEIFRSASFLKHIGHHKIEEINIMFDNGIGEVNQFLQTCDGLKKLKLTGCLPPYDPKVHKYQLSCLEIHLRKHFDEREIDNFLQPHKESLKKLIVHDFDIAGHFEVVKCALKNTKIEELDYMIDYLPEEILTPNDFMKKLRINVTFLDHSKIKEFYSITKAFMNVEDLVFVYSSEFESMLSEILRNFSQCFKNLKHLTLCREMGLNEILNLLMSNEKLPRVTSTIESVDFDKLETLKIKKIHSQDEHKSWISLAMCCPNLKKVFITQIDKSSGCSFSIASSDLKKFLNSCKNLQELHIGPHFDITDEFIETILNSESKSFWYLKIESKNFEEDCERAKEFEGTKIRCEIVRCYKSDELERFYD